jgi:hypothetical protein
MEAPVQISLYTEEAQIEEESLSMLRQHGFIPVKVASQEAVRLMALPVPPLAPERLDAISLAAIRTIASFSGNVPQKFGELVAKTILTGKAD